MLEDNEGADEAFTRALALDRSNSFALLALAYLRYDEGSVSEARGYYDTYRSLVRQQSARGLWLGIQLAQEAEDADSEASYVMALSNHPGPYRERRHSQLRLNHSDATERFHPLPAGIEHRPPYTIDAAVFSFPEPPPVFQRPDLFAH